MKWILLIIVFLYFSVNISFTQDYRTYYGDGVSPHDTIHVLNIFINIVFDQCPACDPLYGEDTPNWLPGNTTELNDNPPVYLPGFMDSEFDPENIEGVFTKIYAEASFNKFVVLGDFVTVNIPQSFITPSNPNSSFSYSTLMNSAVSYINNLGGLETQYGHDELSYYDGYINHGNRFELKDDDSADGEIDFVQFFIRNCDDYYGDMEDGGHAGIYVTECLLVEGVCRYIESFKTTVCGAIRNKDLSTPLKIPAEIHEMAHHLIEMRNRAHMGGGIPLNDGDLITLSSNSGWSIIGGPPSCLVSCNGYERWRLDWLGPSNDDYPIAASNQNADIEKAPGITTLYLRDFVTYGDAIRIKLPYTDAGALNQYIWLEYHRIHLNGKIDYPTYYNASCKDYGIPGVFAYYQVGKNLRESTSSDDLTPDITDHLIPICADGRWDIRKLPETMDACMYGTDNTNIQEYYQENPLCGYNDLHSYHYFNDVPENILNWSTSGIREKIIKKQGGLVTNRLHSLGDNGDPFAGTKTFNISTNPVPTNVITYHYEREGDGTITKSSRADNRKIHLSGLRIDMSPQANQTYKVDIRWDYYYVMDNVMWAGDIILHERVDLIDDFKITFDQNQTPDLHLRDSRTGLFSGPTFFTCLENSEFEMYQGSDVELKNLSSFIVEPNGRLEIKNNAKFVVNQGTTLMLKANSNLYISGTGLLEVEPGGCICIEDGANITLQQVASRIHLKADANQTTNPLVLPDRDNCQYNLVTETFSGSGDIIIDVNPQDTYIQNETISNTQTITGRDIYAGEKVTQHEYFGPVKINSGANVILDATRDIILDKGFEAALGSQLTLQ